MVYDLPARKMHEWPELLREKGQFPRPQVFCAIGATTKVRLMFSDYLSP